MAESMPPEDSLEAHLLEEDYYAFLNLNKDATERDINNSYRRLSKLYHPDKHTDPLLKKNAEVLFNKTKVAYEVLNDPHQRAIYDTLGVKGLQTEGWQIVQRTKTPQEIREEYEQLLKEKEERTKQQSTNAKGTTVIGVNATDLFENYDFRGLPSFEISDMTLSQSVEWPAETTDIFSFRGNLSTQNGIGNGTCNCSWKKLISSQSWLEGGVGAGDGVIFSLKGFRSISEFPYSFVTLHSSFHFVGEGLSPGVELMLARQLAKKTSGFITLKGGKSSAVNTLIMHENEKERFMYNIHFGIHRSYLMFSYSRNLENNDGKIKCSIKFGIFGFSLEYGCEKKISKHSTLGATMVVAVPNGVTLKIRVSRASQTFVFPILLSVEVLPSAVFYGTVVPVLGYFVLKSFYIDPYNEKQKKRQSEKTKEANAQRMAERRKEAAIAVSLMQETYRRIKFEEERKKGLVIQLAAYGSVENITNLNIEQVASQLDVLDATVALQCLVKDSRLILPNRSKSNLPGFYDPCLGEEKMLRVDYLYREVTHSVNITDNEMLRIP